MIADWLMDRVLFPFLMGAMVLLLIGVGVGIFYEITADRFHLRKDEWTCTEHRIEKTPRLIGKIIVYVDTSVCVQWSRP